MDRRHTTNAKQFFPHDNVVETGSRSGLGYPQVGFATSLTQKVHQGASFKIFQYWHIRMEFHLYHRKHTRLHAGAWNTFICQWKSLKVFQCIVSAVRPFVVAIKGDILVTNYNIHIASIQETKWLKWARWLVIGE